MKISPLIDIELLRLVEDSIISDVCKGSGECLELKNTLTVRKLENANKSCLTVPLLNHPEVRDTRDGSVRESRGSRVSPHNLSSLPFDYSLAKNAQYCIR